MALIPCPNCGRQISDKAKTCPQCGYVLSPDELIPTQTRTIIEKKLKCHKKRIWFLRVLAACILIGAGFFIYNHFSSPMFDESNIGKYKDYTHEQLIALANQNDLEAITQIGRNALQSGDSIKAYQWFMKAAEEGYAVAEHNVGVCLYEGLGVTRNLTKANYWAMKAAKRGFAPAQHNIGIAYINGEGTEKNAEEAFKWFMKAAKQDYPNSQLIVALCYNYGIGTKENKADAQKWIKRIAKEYHKSIESVYTDLESLYDLLYRQHENEVVVVEEVVDVIPEDTTTVGEDSIFEVKTVGKTEKGNTPIIETEHPRIMTNIPAWLEGGRWIHTFIDPTFNEPIYWIYEFQDSQFRFVQSRDENDNTRGRKPFKYKVDNNIIYDNNGEPRFIIDSRNKILKSYSKPSEIYYKERIVVSFD